MNRSAIVRLFAILVIIGGIAAGAVFAIILVMVAADRFGLVSYLTRPFDRIKKHQAMLAAWFIFSTVVFSL